MKNDALTASSQGTLELFGDNESFDSSRPLRPARNLSYRQARVVAALLKPVGGWITREAIDSIAAASNGPDVIAQLRDKLGDARKELIMTRRERIINCDGKPSFPGRYALSAKGRQRLIERGLACAV